jgi:hypothetical protein
MFAVGWTGFGVYEWDLSSLLLWGELEGEESICGQVSWTERKNGCNDL